MTIRRSLLLSVTALASACAPTGGQPTDAVLVDYGTLPPPIERAVHPLDPTIRPTDLDGAAYVGVGADHEVYMVDWASGAQTQITDDGVAKGEAVFSEEYIAWIAYPQLADQELAQAEIYVLDRQTGAQQVITPQPAPRMQLVLDGHRLAWADKRNEINGDYTAYDIYAYDLATGAEIAVAVAPGAQHQPSLSGDRLVWADNRDSPHRDGVLAGCADCAENRFDLYLYDFSTQTTRTLVTGEGLRTSPSISGSRVAWIGYAAEPTVQSSSLVIGLGDVYLLDLDTDQFRQLTQTPQTEVVPLLAGDRLLWTVRTACDVVTIQVGETPTPLHTGVYAFDLNTDQVTTLTEYVEPAALFNGNAALIVKGCMVGFEAYVVPLD